MDITAFIRELLFGHDCVILPGFGGFLGNYSPARIDRESGTFYPPVKQISFNRNLNNNDGLLIGKITMTSGITYGDARSLVEEFVTDLRKKLEKGEKVAFDHIGTFINNEEGNVQFEPDITVNYHLDSYGLESFQCMPLEGYDVRKRIVKYQDPVRRASMRKMLWRAAVIIPLLSVIIAIPFKTDRLQTSNLNPLVAAEFESNKKAIEEAAPSIENTAEAVVVPLVTETPIIDEPAPVTEKISETAGYLLITGSFKSEANAELQANMLKQDGFDPEIFQAPNGFFRVSAMVCSDMNSALQKKDSLSGKYPQTWVSRKK